jgi:hypothetical protein
MAETIDHVALVRKLTDELNAIRAQVPYLLEPRPKSDLVKLISAASVPDEFVEKLGGVLASSGSETGETVHVDVDRMLDQRRFAAAFVLLEAQARAFADSLRATLTIVRHESGTRALVAYAATQSLQRLPGGQDLAPHVRNLRKVLGRGRTRKIAESQPAPVPSPDPHSTT